MRHTDGQRARTDAEVGKQEEKEKTDQRTRVHGGKYDRRMGSRPGERLSRPAGHDGEEREPALEKGTSQWCEEGGGGCVERRGCGGVVAVGRLRVRALIRKHARRRGSAAAGPGRCRLPGPGRRAWPGAPGFLHVI